MKVIGTCKILALTLLISTITACENDSVKPVANPSDEYFPLKDGTQWTYQRELIMTNDDADVWSTSNITFEILYDTTFNGITYKRLLDPVGYNDKLIRKEAGRYYARDYGSYLHDPEDGNKFSKEYLFLDTNKQVGESWIEMRGNLLYPSKIVYTIKAFDETRKIFDKTYKNVIEVQADYYENYPGSQDIPWVTIQRYYAKDVGEVASYYPYPLSGFYSNSKFSLINF